MKTLKTKKSHLATCWLGLKNVPPAKYPKVEEIEKAPEILDSLKESLNDFVVLVTERENLLKDYPPNSQITDKAEIEAINDVNKRIKAVENKYSTQDATVEFEDDYFNTLYQMFERWGKDWFTTIEAFIVFRKAMTVTNAQPKEKKTGR